LNYAIQAENLTKVYGKGHTEITALSNATLSVSPGELAAVLGPSGSGKTTMLTTMGLINEPTRGRVVIDGVTVANDRWVPGLDLKRLRREKLGFIFQAYNLIPFLTAVENVMVSLSLNGIKGKEARIRAAALLDKLMLGRVKKNYPSELSGGETQRVAIARALANRPKVILADEPTAALDTANGRNVMDLLKKLAMENNSAIMVVTHDSRMIEGFDRIYEIHDGRIIRETNHS
jgi:putative ABC transport system ATP-binding protein